MEESKEVNKTMKQHILWKGVGRVVWLVAIKSLLVIVVSAAMDSLTVWCR